MKIGDKVQFLSEIGGGKIAGFQGKDIALLRMRMVSRYLHQSLIWW